MGIRAIIGAFFVIAAAGLSGPALACDHWDISGPYTMDQANHLTVTGKFQQNGGDLTGDATFYSKTFHTFDGSETPVYGDISQAFVNGKQIRFRVDWRANWEEGGINGGPRFWSSTGIYEGTIHDDGSVEGTNFDLRQPANKVHWSLHDPAKCTSIVLLPGEVSHAFPHNNDHHVNDQILHSDVLKTSPGGGSANDHHVNDQVILHSDVLKTPPGSAPRCAQGFVWREASGADFVCVAPESRSLAAQENDLAPSRRNPAGAYGPNTCISGFVWREAFQGDVTCVTPERRTAVASENSAGPSRTQ